MFIVLLKFSENRDKAGRFMADHREWLARGFDDGVFVPAGSLVPASGGGILANGISLTDLKTRVSQDPFVAENVVSAEILELTPSRTDARLEFLRG